MDPSQPYFPTKNKKKREKRDSSTGVFLLILRNFQEHLFKELLRWLLLKMNMTKPNYCNNIAIEQMLSLNDSFWIILATHQNGHIVTFFDSKPKVKMKQNQMENFFLYSFWKWWLFSRGRCNCTQCTPSVTSLIFRRTIFSWHILTTFIIQNIHKSWINQWFM